MKKERVRAFKERPSHWTYKDRFSHERHNAYLKSRSQTWYRCRVGLEEGGWELTIEDFFEFWDTEEKWNRRGTEPDDLVLTRKDLTKPWSKDNCILMSRLERIQKTNFLRRGKKYKQKNKEKTK